MASSDVVRFLRKQYLYSLSNEDNSSSSDPILAKFKEIRGKLQDESTALTTPESISWLSDLNDALTDWQNLKDKKSIKRIFFFRDHVAKKRSAIKAKLNELGRPPVCPASSSSAELSQPKSLDFDCYRFYKPDRVTCIEDDVTNNLERWMVNFLTSGNGFKAVAIHGPCSSGNAALVKKVLKQKSVGDKFKCIVWACLSGLTCEKEVDDGIIQYLLYRLGLDTDNLVGNAHENQDWLMEELVRRLRKSRNYILVLDDMWYCSKWFSDNFLGELKKTGVASAVVIVTSRRKTVAEQFGEMTRPIYLNPSVYKERAFLDSMKTQPGSDDHDGKFVSKSSDPPIEEFWIY